MQAIDQSIYDTMVICLRKYLSGYDITLSHSKGWTITDYRPEMRIKRLKATNLNYSTNKMYYIVGGKSDRLVVCVKGVFADEYSIFGQKRFKDSWLQLTKHPNNAYVSAELKIPGWGNLFSIELTPEFYEKIGFNATELLNTLEDLRDKFIETHYNKSCIPQVPNKVPNLRVVGIAFHKTKV